MPTRDYRLKSGERVSGVTTIIGSNLGWSKNALVHWAWKQGKEGLDYKVTKDAAAEAGTIAHALIEYHLKGDGSYQCPPGASEEVRTKADTAFRAFLEFEEVVGLKVLESEGSYVSETHKYGGTIDIASVKKVTAIVDIKTSNDVYPDHKIQLAAYGRLWDEHHPENPIKAYYIIQLGKNDGSFTYHFYPNLDKGWEAFLCLLRLHQLKKEMDK